MNNQDTNNTIKEFVNKQIANQVPVDQIQETIFIAITTSLEKTLRDLDQTIPQSTLQEISQEAAHLAINGETEKANLLLNQSLQSTGGEPVSISRMFQNNLRSFLSQL